MRQRQVRTPYSLFQRMAWLLALATLCIACTAAAARPVSAQRVGYQYYEIGDVQASRPGQVQPGLMMVGGGDWPYEAFRWMVAKAGNGRIVILRASGSTEAQDEFFSQVGGITGAQTLVFQDRAAASDPEVLDIVRKADGLFIAGGDQSNYVRFWKGTPLNDAINRHVREGKPLGGTSAGLAIMGAYSYGAMDGGSLTSELALKEPLGPAVTLVEDFLHLTLLPAGEVITDSHFAARDRLGRLMVFVARLSREHAGSRIKGLGVDEYTALCIDGDGIGTVFSGNDGKAWLVTPGQPIAEVADQALDLSGFSVIGIGSGSRLALPAFTVEQPAFRSRAEVRQGRVVVRPLD